MLKMLQLWFRSKTATDAADSLDAFGSERRSSDSGSAPSGPWLQFSAPFVIAILISAGAAGGYFLTWRPFNVEAASASLTIESDPSGAEVFDKGVRQGITPLSLSIAPGEHAFELVYQGQRKPLRTTARAGAAVVHHVQLDSGPPPRTKASLSVVTEPARLRILLDGKALGVSPLLASDLEPGKHRVQVVGATGTVERRVDLYAGETASVILSAAISAAPAGPSAGWLTVIAPIPLQIVQGSDLIGTTQTARIMLPAGKHNLNLSNEALGIMERRTVQVNAGSTATLRIEAPPGRLSVNALPWAQIWVDGKPAGETPLGNIQVSVGTHEVLFRHPELGERRQTVIVSLKGPARVSVDMRKPQ